MPPDSNLREEPAPSDASLLSGRFGIQEHLWNILHIFMVLVSFPLVLSVNLIARLIARSSNAAKPALTPRMFEIKKSLSVEVKANNKALLGIGAIALVAGLTLQILFGRTNPFYILPSESKTIHGRLGHIVIGSSTRGDVQKLLSDVPEMNDPSSPNKTRYQLSDKAILTVGYDAAGGDFGYANKVVSKEYSAVRPPVASTATAVAAPLPRP